ncbi:MAG: hypothetical protein PHV59_05595, partial [Victivallales bacterium]|nr:hypothetical protein [Victivallales bacterium]
HMPLINELVWIACKANRYGSEPRVISAQLHYLRAQKSRQLQTLLTTGFQAGNISLDAEQAKLLQANTLNADYDSLFRLAQAKKLIPQDSNLAGTKRAMLDRACKLTAARYDPEYEQIKGIILSTADSKWTIQGIREKLLRLWYAFVSVMPFPLRATLPWFAICLTAGYWGACGKRKIYWVGTTVAVIVFTLFWIINAAQGKHMRLYPWQVYRELSIIIFFSIWALIAAIYGKRLHKLAVNSNKVDEFLTCALIICGMILLFPAPFFLCQSHPWWICLMMPGSSLLFDSLYFNPVLVIPGFAAIFCALLYILKIFRKNHAGNILRRKEKN